MAIAWLVSRKAITDANIVEAGCSAGLLLAFDRYAYRDDSGAVWGDTQSRLVIDVDSRGSLPGSLEPGVEILS